MAEVSSTTREDTPNTWLIETVAPDVVKLRLNPDISPEERRARRAGELARDLAIRIPSLPTAVVDELAQASLQR